MRSWMGIPFFLSLIGYSMADYELTDDMTYEFLKKFINHSVDPCDNFYDHTCSFGLKYDEIPLYGFLSKRLLKQLDQESEISELEKDFSRAGLPYRSLLLGLRLQPTLYKHLVGMNIDMKEKMEALGAEFRLFATLLIDQLGKTKLATLNNSTIEKLVEFELNQVVKTPEVIAQNVDLSIIYEILSSNYERLIKKHKLNKKDALTIISTMLRAIYKANIDLGRLLSAFIINNSEWVEETNTVDIYNSYSLMTINMTRPTFWGLVISTLGHELTHPIVDRADHLAAQDPHIKENQKCLADLLDGTWREFSADENNGQTLPLPDTDTHSEAVPDYEGLQAAWLGYSKEFKGRGKELAYKDLGITNDQLFFYGYASSFCDLDERRAYYDNVHPAAFVRVNGIPPLMNGYLEAFQCKPGQRMHKIREKAPADKCNFFGQITRKSLKD